MPVNKLSRVTFRNHLDIEKLKKLTNIRKCDTNFIFEIIAGSSFKHKVVGGHCGGYTCRSQKCHHLIHPVPLLRHINRNTEIPFINLHTDFSTKKRNWIK